jgi:coenzyme F420-0:L-glutamate ligase/coenzyme F420-1:gamma-L-glutamate ligase
VAVLISDSFGRAWRIGTCAVAIGCAGLAPVRDQRGETDRFGRVLKVTQPASADQLAAAAALVMGEASEGLPVAIIRGFALAGSGVAMDMVRAPADDLFG